MTINTQRHLVCICTIAATMFSYHFEFCVMAARAMASVIAGRRNFHARAGMAAMLLLPGLGFCVSSLAYAEASASQGTVSAPAAAASSGASAPEDWSVWGQFTNVTQWHPAFRSQYSGQNSLNPHSDSKETTDLTLFAGLRLSDDSELWVNSEIDQGFGLSNTVGMAGYPSGEAYKIGANEPYLRFPRLFYRTTIGLGGAEQAIAPAANQLGGAQLADNITLTVGKFSVVDVFDTNTYAHDPRIDFMNWAIVESGAFDYAADSWGYSAGAAAEYSRARWTWRAGLFALSKVPNEKTLDLTFDQHELVTELEERHQLSGQPGKLKLLLFVNHGLMGSYQDAVALARQTNSTPDTALVRRGSSNTGFAINFEQAVSTDLGLFARASKNAGTKEAFDFTEINQSFAAGFSLQGDRWARHNDTFGVAAVVNGLSSAAKQYFGAGGIGILIGDGQLPHYAPEKITETYYSLRAFEYLKISLDYQYVLNPAYNHDRGPVSIYGLRVHGEL